MKPLDVVVPYSNPIMWRSRRRVHDDFEDRMLATEGVRLTTVECAYGDRPFELPDRPGVNRVRVRASTLVWNKENLVNLGVQRLPHDWEYLCVCDGDVQFRKPTWALEAVHALQMYHVIQPWSDCYDLGPNGEHLQAHRSFLRQWWHGQPVSNTRWKFDGGAYEYPHSGYAWCFTRQAFEWLGGLLEVGAVGAGDHHMALALVNRVMHSVPGQLAESYVRHLLAWEGRAQRLVGQRLGFLWGTIEHSWHGRKADRRYVDRWSIIKRHGFDPDTDLKRNSYGVLELAGNKPGLAHDLDAYFRQRNEDANSVD